MVDIFNICDFKMQNIETLSLFIYMRVIDT
jgi:hypothetical protein